MLIGHKKWAPNNPAVLLRIIRAAGKALLEARQQGRRIPNNLALLTLDDNDLAGELSPRLSTISFDSHAMGTHAGEMIVDRLDPRSERKLPSSICLDLERIPDETT